MNEEIANGNALLSEKEKNPPFILYFLVILLLAIVFFYYFISFSPVDGESMRETLQDKQCVVLQRRGYNINRGDIVTLDTSESGEPHILIKRVIALSGDKLLFVRTQDDKYVDMYICKSGENSFTLCEEPYIMERMVWKNNPDSTLYEKINVLPYIAKDDITNIRLDETYEDSKSDDLKKKLTLLSLTVPTSSFFYMGDNRNRSSDARHYGTRNLGKITGKVISILDENSLTEKFFKFIFNVK